MNAVSAAVLLQAFRSTLDPGSACYVAGPITSAPPWDVHLTSDESEALNRAKLRTAATELRRSLHIPVIDSGVLVVPGWVGSDYSRFFLDVIRMYATQIRFIEGWQFSLGATKEYVFGCSLGIDCLSVDGAEIVPATARELIERAATEYLEGGDRGRASKLGSRLASFDRL